MTHKDLKDFMQAFIISKFITIKSLIKNICFFSLLLSSPYLFLYFVLSLFLNYYDDPVL